MLKKTQRISTNRIPWLLKKGVPFNNEYFSAKFLLNKGPENRYSVVVSKKVKPLATERNLLRRQLYEIIRQRTPTSPTADFVLIVKTRLAALSFEQKASALEQTFKQINLKLN